MNVPKIDIKQKTINTILVITGLVTTTIAVLVYLDRKKHEKITSELASLDKEIKSLQLYELKNKNGKV